MTASFLSGRGSDDAQTTFFHCLVDNGIPIHPLLRTIDTALAPWLRCTTPNAAAAGAFTILNLDNSEADLAVLRYWDCLAANGLRYPDTRAGAAQPDLAMARRAMTSCRALAVTVVQRTEEFSGGD